MSPRWRKVLADLWTNKIRTVLAVLSIAVGVMAVGLIATSYVIIGRDMDASYREITPAGGFLVTSYFGPDFVTAASHVPGVGQVEGRGHIGGFKLLEGDQPAQNLNLVMADFAKMRLDRVFLRSGDWPGQRELMLERNSAARLAARIGDTLVLEMPDGKQRELRYVGTVEDRTTDSTNTGLVGYVTVDTMEYLGQERWFNWLLFTPAEQANDKAHVREVGRAIEEQFTRNGGLVGTTIIRDPGKHPAASQSAAVMGMLAALGVLTVLLSAFLVINTISALMVQQMRYIGVMKAVGARAGQIMGMYIVLLLVLGMMALLIAGPLGLWLGYVATGQIANVLNFRIADFQLEVVPLVIMVVLSLVVPLLAGLLPVRNGARTTIRAAISGYGLNAAYGRSLIDRLFSLLRGVSRPMLISLRNTVRRKARLVLTLATLVLGGAIFMGVISAQGSMTASLDTMYRYYQADVNVDFDRAYRVENMNAIIAAIPGVTRAEGWIFAAGEVLASDEAGGHGKVATDRITLMSPPSNSAVVERSVLSGRWLLPEDQNAIVMCTTAMSAHPEWHVGSTVRLKLNTKAEADFVIVGTFPFASGEGNKISIAKYEYVADLLNERGQASSYRIVTAAHDAATQDQVRDALTSQFKQMGYKAVVSSGHTSADSLGTILNTIVGFLLGMATLIALVGGLGLMGAMTMNVMERTREIGVMRSIGASNGAILRLVVVEGLLTGLLSWALGCLLSIPIGQLLSTVLGKGLFGTPFAFIFATSGLFAWLAAVVVLSLLASALPAWNASRLTVREVLAYE